MKKWLVVSVWSLVFSAFAATSEINVGLKMANDEFVVGERVRCVVDIVNISTGQVLVHGKDFDRFFIEVKRAHNHTQLEPYADRPFVANFRLAPNEGQKLEAFLGDHYGLRHVGRYLAQPVLVHNGIRYEGQMRAFDIVPGMEIATATQIFANHPGLTREFKLVSWSRKGKDHLFLQSQDLGASDHKWETFDIGLMRKTTRPTISLLPTGVVVVLHRFDSDNFVRSEFWSVPDGIEFDRRELVGDPETAGTKRVRELYKQSGGVEPKKNPWYKFW